MGFRTALSKAIGLGSAHAGTHHWWLQRLTAIALLPLTLWLVWFMRQLSLLDHGGMLSWLGKPLNGALILAYVSIASYHAQLGLREVIVDYVHHPALRITSLVGMWMVMLFLTLLAWVAMIKILAGG